jgi:hypothetical protein
MKWLLALEGYLFDEVLIHLLAAMLFLIWDTCKIKTIKGNGRQPKMVVKFTNAIIQVIE